MPENEFEKQVQQKMDELAMAPSDVVWQKVQAQIPARKERRRPIWIWLPFVLVATLIAAYFLYDHTETTRPSIQNETVKSNQNQPAKNTVTAGQSGQPVQTIPGATEENIPGNITGSNTSIHKINQPQAREISAGNVALSAVKAKRTGKENDENTERSTDKGSQQSLQYTTAKSTAIAAAERKRHLSAAKKKMTITNAIPNETAPAETGNIGSVQKETVEPANANQETIVDSASVNDAVKENKSLIQKENVDAELINKAVVKANKKNEKISKWKFGLSFAGGFSYTSSRYLSNTANSSYYAPAVFDNLNNSPSGIGTGASQGNTIYVPSAVKPSLALNIGFMAARRLSHRSNLAGGINYKYYSTSFSVGQPAQFATAANTQRTFFTGTTGKYRNQYHFIEVPLSFQFRIGKEKAHSWYGDVGMLVSQLIQTNALQFNNQGGYYYSANNLFGKTIFGVSAGLSVNLLKNKNAPLLLGPSIYYSLTPVAATGLYANTHYSFLGIRLQKYLKRK